MSLANSLREAKGGACPPFLRSYHLKIALKNALEKEAKIPASNAVARVARKNGITGISSGSRKSAIRPRGMHVIRQAPNHAAENVPNPVPGLLLGRDLPKNENTRARGAMAMRVSCAFKVQGV